VTLGPKHLARRVIEIYAFQALSLGASLVVSIVVARSLGPNSKGIADLVVGLAAIAAEVVLLGLNGGLLYLLANKRRPAAEIHGAALLFSVVAGVAGLSAAALIGDWVAEVLAIPREYAVLAFCSVGPTVYLAIWPSALIGMDRAPFVYRVQFALAALYAAGVLGFLVTGALDLRSFIGWTVAWWALSLLVEVAMLARLHRPYRPRPRWASLKAALAYGLKLYPGNLANWIHFRSDQFVVAALLGPSAVGLYALSARWAELLLLVGYGVATAGLHQIASLDPAAGHLFAKRLALSVLGITASVGAILGVSTPFVLPGVYGEAFSGAVVPLLLLIPGIILWDGARILSQFISYNAGRPEIPTMVAVGGAVANVVLALIIVPALGIAGAALASTLTYASVVIATWIIFLRWKHVPQAH